MVTRRMDGRLAPEPQRPLQGHSPTKGRGREKKAQGAARADLRGSLTKSSVTWLGGSPGCWVAGANNKCGSVLLSK